MGLASALIYQPHRPEASVLPVMCATETCGTHIPASVSLRISAPESIQHTITCHPVTLNSLPTQWKSVSKVLLLPRCSLLCSE